MWEFGWIRVVSLRQMCGSHEPCVSKKKTWELCVQTCNCGLSKTDLAQHVENGTTRGRCRYTAVKYGAGSLSSCGNVS